MEQEYAIPLFKAGAEWRINSVWHSITVIPDCHRFIVDHRGKCLPGY